MVQHWKNRRDHMSPTSRQRSLPWRVSNIFSPKLLYNIEAPSATVTRRQQLKFMACTNSLCWPQLYGALQVPTLRIWTLRIVRISQKNMRCATILFYESTQLKNRLSLRIVWISQINLRCATILFYESTQLKNRLSLRIVRISQKKSAMRHDSF